MNERMPPSVRLSMLALTAPRSPSVMRLECRPDDDVEPFAPLDMPKHIGHPVNADATIRDIKRAKKPGNPRRPRARR